MNKFPLAVLVMILGIFLVLLPYATAAESPVEPGATVRNIFGPDMGLGANQCRGACGGGCPRSCTVEVSFECLGDIKLRRVQAHNCGTHQGCRSHDNCLDNCMLNDLSLIHI